MAQHVLSAPRMRAQLTAAWRDVELLLEGEHVKLAALYRMQESQRQLWMETFGEEPPAIQLRAFTEREERAS